jgi:hypothetical protein
MKPFARPVHPKTPAFVYLSVPAVYLTVPAGSPYILGRTRQPNAHGLSSLEVSLGLEVLLKS